MTTRPKAPWTKEESAELFQKSQVDGHRKVILKCEACGLEFAVFTWRNGSNEELGSHFPCCPECGTAGSSVVIRVDHELQEIFRAHQIDQIED